MFGIVIDNKGYKVAFVVLKDGVIQDYTLKSGETVVTKDWQKANAMGKPHWTGAEWEDLEPPKQIDILSVKQKKIQESKELLAKWLSENPMESEIHSPKGAHYTVTQEKQAQLTQLLTLYSIAKQAGTEMQLTWNASGGVCEEWTYEQLSTLSFQIAGYVLPRVKKQQQFEVAINQCTTTEEVNKIEIEYDTI